MSLKDHLRKLTSYLLKVFLEAPQSVEKFLNSPKKILVIRQHNQFGDLLASISLFRAVKESYPESKITLIASPQNYQAVVKNKFIDELFIFSNKDVWNPKNAGRLIKILRSGYDLAIAPATVAVSLTSCILTGLSNAKIKIGPGELNGNKNDLAFVFHHKIKLDWRKCPDAHVSDFILEIARPLGINTKNFMSAVFFDDGDKKFASDFINSFSNNDYDFLIGFHVGAGKLQNRWQLEKFVELITRIRSDHKIKFYFTGSNSDNFEIDYMKKYFGNECGYFLDRTVPQLAALITQSNFFITNDTGVMHVAGTTSTPQISLFGPTNPFNWAPIGSSKYFIRKSELISDITVDDVYNLFNNILERHPYKK